MANRTAWTAGNGAGLTWTTLLSGTELNALANGSSCLLGVSVTNGSPTEDQFIDISVKCTVTSGTTANGAAFGLYLLPLLQDGSTYGSGEFASLASTLARAPAVFPIGAVPLPSAIGTQTLLAGAAIGLILPPGTFGVALLNASGLPLASSNAVYYRTYNINLNN